MKISVLGSGGWGTALAILLRENGHALSLWSAFPEESERLQKTRQNPYLPGIPLAEEIHCTADMACAREAELIVLATPSFAVRSTAKMLREWISPKTPVVIVSKGIEQASLKNFCDVVRDELEPDIPLVALSGPSHAEEVARGIPTACVAAAEDMAVARFIQDAFMSERFRVYTTTDVIGVELGAALKNVIALCAGVSDGMGYGDNTIAMLVTRGLSEISTLAVALGGKRETLAGLAGLGDLIVTCTSRHSRNRRAGELIGQGMDVQAAMEKVGAVVEGYYAARAAYALAEKAGVEMPISQELYRVLYEGKRPECAMRDLMSRSKKVEYGDSGAETWVNQ